MLRKKNAWLPLLSLAPRVKRECPSRVKSSVRTQTQSPLCSATLHARGGGVAAFWQRTVAALVLFAPLSRVFPGLKNTKLNCHRLSEPAPFISLPFDSSGHFLQKSRFHSTPLAGRSRALQITELGGWGLWFSVSEIGGWFCHTPRRDPSCWYTLRVPF